MGKQLFANNASALLAASIDDNDLTIQVESGFGARFPNPGANEEFIVSLINAAGDIEYCRITSRATDLLTVASGGRGYDGSSAQAWTNGQTRVEYRLTKKVMEEFIQRSGDTMSGDLDMDENDLKDAHVTGAATLIDGGQIVGVPLRGTADDSSNEIAVPADGSRATSGGSAILTEGDDEGVATAAFSVGMIMDWYGAAVDCPDGWAICDGTNGTPDMRGLFSIGVDGSHALGTSGGSATTSGNTASDGGSTTGGHALTVAELATHDHGGSISSSSITLPMTDDDNSQPPYTRLEGSNVGSPSSASFSVTLNGTIAPQGSGDAHTHSTPNHSHAISNLAIIPPYRALYKIMFIGF